MQYSNACKALICDDKWWSSIVRCLQVLFTKSDYAPPSRFVTQDNRTGDTFDYKTWPSEGINRNKAASQSLGAKGAGLVGTVLAGPSRASTRSSYETTARCPVTRFA